MLKWLGFRESFANFLVLFFVLALIFSVILPLYPILHLSTHLLIKLFLVLFFIRTSRLGLETSTSIIVRALTSRRHLISSFISIFRLIAAKRFPKTLAHFRLHIRSRPTLAQIV